MRSRECSVPTTVLTAILFLGAGACEAFTGKDAKPDSGTPADAIGAKDVAVGSGGGAGTGGAGTGGAGIVGTGGQPGGVTGSGGEFGGGSGAATGACTAGAKQCDGLQPQVCEGGTWKNTGTPCSFVCSSVTGACTGVCTPGARRCNALQPQVCDANGAWQNSGSSCAMVCNSGSCMACTANDKQCNGLQPQVCESGAWKSMGTPCPFVCSATTGACGGVCTPGAKQCNALQPQLCDATGAWQSMGTACPMVCTSGSCTACAANAKQCNGLQPQVCSSGGAWQNMGTACPFVCATGTCSGTCTPGAKQCSGMQPQLCDATGTWKNSGSACQFVCSAAGNCTGTCVPGAKQCGGSQPQMCDANGAWQNSGSACGVCNPCSASTGTCAVAAGTKCDDGNKCTNDTTCQSNGTCGGGTTMTCSGADVCHTVGACVPASGCPAAVLKMGADCEDGKMCTGMTKCQADGTCGGGTIVNRCDDNPCKTGRTCQEPNATCSAGSSIGKGTDCGNGKVCDDNGNCNCRTKSTWNMLGNPGFDGGAGNWTLEGAAAYNGNIDVNSCSGSGSVKVNALSDGVFQCVTLPSTPTGARTFYFGYRFKGTGSGNCLIIFYGGSGCSGTQLGGATLEVDVSGTSWIQPTGSATSTADTNRILLRCSGVMGSGNYDQIFLSSSSQSAGTF